ncbi:calcium/sodium antiporter [Clostridium butyricum]|uniref:calcium/sodium antiporter n=1 Tax=Clostridium butyricum TaxID=1492 RepID=UPI003D0DE8FC
MNYIILLVGFALLIKGADIFVDGASALAKKMGIPPVIVGLTIVSIGTSAPELAVSLISALNGSNNIAIGNVVGSNIFNTLMVLGVTTIVLPIIIHKKNVKNDFIVNTVITILLFILTFDSLLGKGSNIISRFDGLILLIICLAYMVMLVVKAKKTDMPKPTEEELNVNVFIKILLIIVGAAGIVIGGQLVVNSASNIASSLGMSEKLVGLTIVAMGTSLPELVTSVVAALKGENEIALGNVLGSNIFNILLILGTSSVISPIVVESGLIVDFGFLIAITLLLYLVVFLNKQKEKKLTKLEGIIMVALYAGYIVYIISRN